MSWINWLVAIPFGILVALSACTFAQALWRNLRDMKNEFGWFWMFDL